MGVLLFRLSPIITLPVILAQECAHAGRTTKKTPNFAVGGFSFQPRMTSAENPLIVRSPEQRQEPRQ